MNFYSLKDNPNAFQDIKKAEIDDFLHTMNQVEDVKSSIIEAARRGGMKKQDWLDISFCMILSSFFQMSVQIGKNGCQSSASNMDEARKHLRRVLAKLFLASLFKVGALAVGLCVVFGIMAEGGLADLGASPEMQMLVSSPSFMTGVFILFFIVFWIYTIYRFIQFYMARSLARESADLYSMIFKIQDMHRRMIETGITFGEIKKLFLINQEGKLFDFLENSYQRNRV